MKDYIVELNRLTELNESMGKDRRTLLQTISALTLGVSGVSGAVATTETASAQRSDRPPQSGEQTDSSDDSIQELVQLVDEEYDAHKSFGRKVAISGDGSTAAVGAPDVTGNGKAYVFTGVGKNWTKEATLEAEDGDGYDNFGSPVAVSQDGTTILAGAVNDEDPNGENAGSAYAFQKSGGSWSQQAKILPDDGGSGDSFGSSIGLADDGKTAVIGASNDENPNGSSGGSAYIFEETNGNWKQQAKLSADDGESDDRFGWAAAMSNDGTTALIGANENSGVNPKPGSAYVFGGDDWSQQAKLTPNKRYQEDYFGTSVALSADGTTALIGAVGAQNEKENAVGAAYLFEQENSSWTQQMKLTTSRWGYGDAVSLSADGTTALVTAKANNYQGEQNVGKADLVDISGDSPQKIQSMRPSEYSLKLYFGDSADLSNDAETAIFGTEDISQGKAFIFGQQPEMPPVVGQQIPRDLDDDGLYEDVNGDGSFDIFDIQALFGNLESEAIQNNPEAFNFSGDDTPDEVDIFDVQALFQRLQQS